MKLNNKSLLDSLKETTDLLNENSNLSEKRIIKLMAQMIETMEINHRVLIDFYEHYGMLSEAIDIKQDYGY